MTTTIDTQTTDENVVVILEGKELELPKTITDDDETLRKALAAFFPGAASAAIDRKKKDGVEKIHITKKADHLG